MPRGRAVDPSRSAAGAAVRIGGANTGAEIEHARTDAAARASVTLRDVAQSIGRLDHDGVADPQRPRDRRAHPRGDPRAGAHGGGGAGLQAEPARARPARAAAARCWVSSPATSRPVPHPDPAGHQRARPCAGLPDVPGPRRLPRRTWRSPTARCSSGRTPTGSSSSATSRAATRRSTCSREQHRYVVGVTDRTDAAADPGRLQPTARRGRSSRSSTCGSSAIARSCASRTPGPRTGGCASTLSSGSCASTPWRNAIAGLHHRPGARARVRARDAAVRGRFDHERARRPSMPRPTRPRSA